MVTRKIIIASLVIISLFTIVVFVGYFGKKSKETREKPSVIVVPPKSDGQPLPVPIKGTTSSDQRLLPTTTDSRKLPKAELLFDNEFIYLGLDFPQLYVYDFNNETINIFDLDSSTYKEIYKIYGLRKAYLADDRLKIVLEFDDNFKLLDLKNDKISQLPLLMKNFTFVGNDLIIYINNESKASYLAYFKNDDVVTIRDLGILDPKFEPLKKSLLIYEDGSPIFLLNLSKPNELDLFKEAKNNYSVLANKNKDLIFISFKEDNEWRSEILTLNKSNKISFNWGIIKEKCSFGDVLVCALPSVGNNFDPESWYNFEVSYDNKIIIYDPKKDKIKEIEIEPSFDIIKPTLTPLGIVFLNRLNSKLYLIKLENPLF